MTQKKKYQSVRWPKIPKVTVDGRTMYLLALLQQRALTDEEIQKHLKMNLVDLRILLAELEGMKLLNSKTGPDADSSAVSEIKQNMLSEERIYAILDSLKSFTGPVAQIIFNSALSDLAVDKKNIPVEIEEELLQILEEELPEEDRAQFRGML